MHVSPLAVNSAWEIAQLSRAIEALNGLAQIRNIKGNERRPHMIVCSYAYGQSSVDSGKSVRQEATSSRVRCRPKCNNEIRT